MHLSLFDLSKGLGQLKTQQRLPYMHHSELGLKREDVARRMSRLNAKDCLAAP